jgi:acyl carrier protein
MTKNEVAQIVLRHFTDQLDSYEVELTSKISSLGMDELDLIDVLLGIEDDLIVNLPEAEVIKETTVQQLVDLAFSKKTE